MGCAANSRGNGELTMASDNRALRDYILNKLKGIGTLTVAFGDEETPTDGSYPFATVVMAGVDAKPATILSNIRKHKFLINIYQERLQTGQGNSNAENIILSVCDEIETAFDLDITLSGTCKYVEPLKANMRYVDRPYGDVRVAQYTLVAVTVAPASA